MSVRPTLFAVNQFYKNRIRIKWVQLKITNSKLNVLLNINKKMRKYELQTEKEKNK